MIKKIIALIICVALVLCTTACKEESESNIDFSRKISGNSAISIFVDEETGVNYIIYHESYNGGLCPRYNADGGLYISKTENYKAGESE